MAFRDLLSKMVPTFGRGNTAAGETTPSTERGVRPNLESWIRRMYMQMDYVDFALRATILQIREMDRKDPRVKKIHSRTARSAAKGGLRLVTSSGNTSLIKRWHAFERRLHLHRRDKLESDVRGLMMEGNLPLQWVVSTDGQPQVVGAVRMPTETLIPLVDETGRFKDPARAYRQVNPMTQQKVAEFALYQLTIARLTPDNYDDWGSLGRPYLDASRSAWQKLTMTEEDMVIRRKTRAPQRMHHNLPNATPEELQDYRARVEQDQAEGNWCDYMTNSEKATVKPVEGDAALDQIADVVHLLDTFGAGAPMPKGLFGYTDGLARDILEDIKQDWYEELDSIQDTGAWIYEFGFRLDLLLSGINPDNWEFSVQFAERNTETLNQRADRALKLQAIGVPKEMQWETAGLDPAAVRRQREAEAVETDPYPDDDAGGGGKPGVKITPSNARKGESGTTISND